MKTICCFFLITFSLFATDLRIASNISVQAQEQVSGTWTNKALGAGGRVGNWRPDNAISGGVIVLDASIVGDTYATDIFTMPAPVGPHYYAQLTSISSTWALGDPSTKFPKANMYVGNPWFCPTTGDPQYEYILFQAQDNSSKLTTTAANPGAGVDNQVWLYRPSDQTAWELTRYTELTHLTPPLVEAFDGYLYGTTQNGPPGPPETGGTMFRPGLSRWRRSRPTMLRRFRLQH